MLNICRKLQQIGETMTNTLKHVGNLTPKVCLVGIWWIGLAECAGRAEALELVNIYKIDYVRFAPVTRAADSIAPRALWRAYSKRTGVVELRGRQSLTNPKHVL